MRYFATLLAYVLMVYACSPQQSAPVTATAKVAVAVQAAVLKPALAKPTPPVVAPPLPAPVPEAQVIMISAPSAEFAALCKKAGVVCWSAAIDQYSGVPPFMAAAEKVSSGSNPPVYTVFTGYGATKAAAEKAVQAQLSGGIK